MEPTRVDRILHEWDEVADRARRPDSPPRRVVVRGGPSMTSLAGTGVILAALLVAFLWLGRPDSNGEIGSDPSRSPSPIVTPSVSPSPSASPTAVPTPTPTQTATEVPSIGPCAPADLAPRITMWEGAAGHRIAHVEMTSTSSDPCTLPTLARPQLVDGRGSVLINGSEPASSDLLTVAPGAVLATLVQDGNYCGPEPVAPVSVAFVLPEGRIVATPASPTDATVPPCLGAPGSAGTIEMQPWAP